ncbi:MULTISPECIES: hypothetical protein [unclassified Streptomyces]|uniref:hypothetical protein n=1 Tax=unclassified Streptomyces TaxID=2593676 RepID=UPI00088ACD0B|nr:MULTISPECIES: hypothetical protein [unclassified Streptomyces]PBC72228.1 hypothetical protein BX261_7310 [Streptomyces sp. 2321.6]SDR62048.1 hypothetical protein SAMN05216511_7259 [Streptomyces sp. KS_16]SEE49842.1 hypothetical protein SAMN05428940_7308 [Streptomyces sp. 2133.1]SNC77863.1 hypothetical protein SAMN06272741_7280 [Streptomyces sp. 2114.4]
MPFKPNEPIGDLEWVDVFRCQACFKDAEFLSIDNAEPGEPSDWAPWGWVHLEEADHRVVPPEEVAHWGTDPSGSG